MCDSKADFSGYSVAHTFFVNIHSIVTKYNVITNTYITQVSLNRLDLN
jgi:hypothetical protein